MVNNQNESYSELQIYPLVICLMNVIISQLYRKTNLFATKPKLFYITKYWNNSVLYISGRVAENATKIRDKPKAMLLYDLVMFWSLIAIQLFRRFYWALTCLAFNQNCKLHYGWTHQMFCSLYLKILSEYQTKQYSGY